MDAHAVSHAILTLISSYYPGGSAKFVEDGGVIAPLPQIGQCLIYHPSPPADFKKKLDKIKMSLGDGLPDIIFSFIDSINFEGMTSDEISGQVQVASEELCNKFNITTVLITPSPVIAIVLLPELQFTSEEMVQDVLDILTRNIEKLVRLIIIGVNGFYPMDLTEPAKVDTIIPEAIKPVAEQTERAPSTSDVKRFIKPDDVTNLRIELELCNDVQEFIDKM